MFLRGGVYRQTVSAAIELPPMHHGALSSR